MADFSTLIATLQATIKTNYRQEITGQILQDDLLAMVNVINQLKQDTLAGYAFHGAPLADGDSVSVTQNTFFLVAEGEYEINGNTIEVDAAGVSVIVYDSVNNTTNWYTLFAYDTTPTANSRNAITSGAVAAALAPLATKEDVEAVEQEVAQVAGEAGLAEAVIDTDGAGTEQEFTFRKSGGDGGAYYRKLLGKSVVVNNQVAMPTSLDPHGWVVQNVAYNSDGSFSVTPNADWQGGAYNDYIPIAGHKYYARFGIQCAGGIMRVYMGGVYLADAEYITKTFIKEIFEATDGTILNLWGTQGVTTTFWDFQLTDLTLMFGAGNEPTTVAEFYALLPLIPSAYNPGTLISNDAEAVETTGVNIFDGSITRDGYYLAANGSEGANSSWYISDFMPVLPNTEYFLKDVVDGPTSAAFCWYDANKNYISGQSFGATSLSVTSPANACYLKTTIAKTTKDIACINLSNPAINGQYFPHWKRTLQLGLTTRKDTDGNVPFADGMKGAGTVSDWADKVGGEVIMGEVDLGDLEWEMMPLSSGGHAFINKEATDIPAGGWENYDTAPCICSKYAVSPQAAESFMSDKTIAVCRWTGGRGCINIVDNDYSNADEAGLAAFKASLAGVKLVFMLATPVPFTWAEPLNLGVKVDENGTEKAVAPEGATAPSAPFVADTTYTMSVARMVEKLRNL